MQTRSVILVVSILLCAGVLGLAARHADVPGLRVAVAAAEPAHGLKGHYYTTHLDKSDGQIDFAGLWGLSFDEFGLPKARKAPDAVRIDPQVAFARPRIARYDKDVPRLEWWTPAGASAVIWKGHLRLPKAGTYYVAPVSYGASAVYLNHSRVALNAFGAGSIRSDEFTYGEVGAPDVSGHAHGHYVVPVTVSGPRDVPIEIRYVLHGVSSPWIDLYWVTPDSPRNAAGKPIAQLVPTEALFVEAPGPITESLVSGPHSTISSDVLYLSIKADSPATLTIRVADKQGRPVPGKRVHVSNLASYGGKDTILQPEAPTNDQGIVTARVKPTDVGHTAKFFATVLDEGVDIGQVAEIEVFSAGNLSFLPAGFAPYYSETFRVSPKPLKVGQKTTITVPLGNPFKVPMEVSVRFLNSMANIGGSNWTKIGETEKFVLKPGESKEVSITWTPQKEEGHLCFAVEVWGRELPQKAASNALFRLIGTAIAQDFRLPTLGGENFSLLDRRQQNIGPVTPVIGPVTPVNEPKCDPKIWANYQTKRQTAFELFRAGNTHLHQASAEFAEWKREETHVFAEVTAVKTGLLKGIERALSEGGKIALEKLAGLLGLATTAAWIYTDIYPHIRDHNQAVEDSRKMTHAGSELARKSLDDLQKDLAQSELCRKERERAETEQKFVDDAKELRDSWELEGRGLYRDPNDPAKNILDAAAALKRAKEQLQGQQQSSLSILRVSVASQETQITVETLRMSLKEIDAALASLTRAQSLLESQKDFENKIQELLEAIIGISDDGPEPVPSRFLNPRLQLTGDNSAAWKKVRSNLRVAVDLASDTLPETKSQRDQALDRLYEQIEAADAEQVLAREAVKVTRDSNFGALVAAKAERPIDYLVAMQRSLARYNAAEAADDWEWKAKQLTAAKKYAALAGSGLAAQAKLDDESAATLQTTSFAVRRAPEKAQAFLEGLKRDGLSDAHRTLLGESGQTVEQIDAYQKALANTPSGELGTSIVELYRQIAQARLTLAASLEQFATGGTMTSGPLSQTFTVGNPHAKEETVDLLIRRASMPPEWTASIVAAAPPPGDKPQGPQIQEVEAGRHYRVRLPAKGEMRVSAVLVPVGVVGENTTARWAVEGKIGDKLLGGIVQEMHVPAYLPDLELPAIGSADTQMSDGRPPVARLFNWPLTWISAGLALLLVAVVLWVFFWRRRHAHARRD